LVQVIAWWRDREGKGTGGQGGQGKGDKEDNILVEWHEFEMKGFKTIKKVGVNKAKYVGWC
jgi:hypothetical protein